MKFHLPKSIPAVRLPHYGERPRPLRDWLALVSIAAIALVASVAWNAWFFVQATRGEAATPVQGETHAPEASVIEKVGTLFAARAQEEARYRGTYRFVDPSK